MGGAFRNFPVLLPDDEALDALYAAFAHRPKPSGPFCRQCFPPESGWRERVLKPVPVREADPDDFGIIFDEHIDCSVEGPGFLYFLPRTFETLIDRDLFPNLVDRAIAAGLYDLEPTEADALAGAAAASLLNFVRGRPVGPLGRRPEQQPPTQRASEEYGKLLAAVLVALRVEPRQIFERLVAVGGERVAMVFDSALDGAGDPPRRRDDLCLGRWICEPDLRRTAEGEEVDVTRILDDIAWIDFIDVVTLDRFEDILSGYAGADRAWWEYQAVYDRTDLAERPSKIARLVSALDFVD
jgi:hypothetical protein